MTPPVRDGILIPTMSQAKLRAARHAVTLVRDGMTVGLGSGSTAALFIRELGQALVQGRLKNLVGIPTSDESGRLARESGIPVVDFDTYARCDVTIDGADEVTPTLDLIKGLGGAMLREKLVAQNSAKLVIIVDESKRVDRLGTRSPLPVEVTKFGMAAHDRFLRSLGAVPMLRMKDGKTYVTDNGNVILDCAFANGISDPAAVNAALGERAGIVEHGLFLGIASKVIVAGESVTTLERP